MTNLDAPVELTERTIIGKKLAGLRNEGLVPGVIHNHGQESIHVALPEPELIKVYKEAGKHHPLQLKVGSNNYLALIKDVHFNPAKRRVQHVVFQAINQNEKVEAEIPIHLDGEIPAEKAGLVVLHQLDTITVLALPKDLPDEIRVDATSLAEIHDKITVEDLALPQGVEVLDAPDHPIATVVETKAQISEESTEEPAEGEAIEGEEAPEDQTEKPEEPKAQE